MTATLGLERLTGRCAHGFDIATQHPALCSCPGLMAAAEGMASALPFDSDEIRP